MKKNIALLAVAVLSLFPAAGLFAGQAEKAAKPAAAKKAVLRAASEMKWVDIPEAKGAQQAVVWGNPQKGAHSSFAKFAGGTEIPMHTHTAGSRSVVIAGTMLEGLEGQQPKELGGVGGVCSNTSALQDPDDIEEHRFGGVERAENLLPREVEFFVD